MKILDYIQITRLYSKQTTEINGTKLVTSIKANGFTLSRPNIRNNLLAFGLQILLQVYCYQKLPIMIRLQRTIKLASWAQGESILVFLEEQHRLPLLPPSNAFKQQWRHQEKRGQQKGAGILCEGEFCATLGFSKVNPIGLTHRPGAWFLQQRRGCRPRWKPPKRGYKVRAKDKCQGGTATELSPEKEERAELWWLGRKPSAHTGWHFSICMKQSYEKRLSVKKQHESGNGVWGAVCMRSYLPPARHCLCGTKLSKAA